MIYLLWAFYSQCSAIFADAGSRGNNINENGASFGHIIVKIIIGKYEKNYFFAYCLLDLVSTASDSSIQLL